MVKHWKISGVKGNIWRLDFVFCLTSIYRHAIPVYGSQTLLTSIYGACLAIYGSQTSKHSQTGRKWIRSSIVNIFCLEHAYTIRYNTLLHTFLCSTTYQKLVFYAGIPLTLLGRSGMKGLSRSNIDQVLPRSRSYWFCQWRFYYCIDFIDCVDRLVGFL